MMYGLRLVIFFALLISTATGKNGQSAGESEDWRECGISHDKGMASACYENNEAKVIYTFGSKKMNIGNLARVDIKVKNNWWRDAVAAITCNVALRENKGGTGKKVLSSTLKCKSTKSSNVSISLNADWNIRGSKEDISAIKGISITKTRDGKQTINGKMPSQNNIEILLNKASIVINDQKSINRVCNMIMNPSKEGVQTEHMEGCERILGLGLSVGAAAKLGIGDQSGSPAYLNEMLTKLGILLMDRPSKLGMIVTQKQEGSYIKLSDMSLHGPEKYLKFEVESSSN